MVQNQASFDHGCPAQNVVILSDSGDPVSRAVWVDACGQRRLYRDLGGQRAYVWVDVTEGGGAQAPR
jgi:hypothetical protein